MPAEAEGSVLSPQSLDSTRPSLRPWTYLLAYGCIALFMLLSHGPLLYVPYYWDEAGQFVPAALDIYRLGALIPHSTLPNVHPPGVMAYLAVFWHVFGYSIAGTRVAMLLVAALGALFAFLLAIELAKDRQGTPAFLVLAMLCFSPLCFAQAMLAQLDMPAMCFGMLALLLFLQDRFRASALACVALVLTKETGLASVALFALWLIAERRWRDALWYAAPVAALAAWLVLLRSGTGHWLGNAEFTQYNLFYPLHPVRLGLALLRRIYYLFAGSGHFIGTAAFIWAWRRTRLFRSRPWRVAAAFACVNVVMVSALGGAVLERYLLPALPILYTAFAVSFGALKPRWGRQAAGALLVCLVAANFIYPLYSFPFENNLAFVSFVGLEKDAAAAVSIRPGTVATTFPLATGLRHPEFGYVSVRRTVIEVRSFRASELQRLDARPPDMMIVYDTAWDPLHLLQSSLSKALMKRFYDFEPPLTPEEISQRFSMRKARRWERRGLSMTLLERDPAARK